MRASTFSLEEAATRPPPKYFIGHKPFSLNVDAEPEMQLEPALPSWLFEDESSDYDPNFDEDGNHIVSFKLFGKILVTYHNPGAKNLLGKPPNSYTVTMTDDCGVEVDGPTIHTTTAQKIRRVTTVKSIDAYYF